MATTTSHALPAMDWLGAARYYSELHLKVRDWRNRAIEGARATAPVDDVVAATRLSPARVKQFPRRLPSDSHGYAVVDPIIDYDRPGQSQGIFHTLADLEETVTQWESEEMFFAANPGRTGAGRRVLLTDMCDEGTYLWDVCHLESTDEIYALSNTGTVALLGRLAADIAQSAIATPAQAMKGRPGGLAWIHSRINLVRTIIHHDITNR